MWGGQFFDIRWSNSLQQKELCNTKGKSLIIQQPQFNFEEFFWPQLEVTFEAKLSSTRERAPTIEKAGFSILRGGGDTFAQLISMVW